MAKLCCFARKPSPAHMLIGRFGTRIGSCQCVPCSGPGSMNIDCRRPGLLGLGGSTAREPARPRLPPSELQAVTPFYSRNRARIPTTLGELDGDVDGEDSGVYSEETALTLGELNSDEDGEKDGEVDGEGGDEEEDGVDSARTRR
ncbi:hypothetical protein NL676_011008 [Syzygium grande]|nr:hypothetical protein NL676_011008 [Syzygium grande]